MKGTAPDWSPDTTTDTFAYADTNGAIAILNWLGGTQFGAARAIAPKIGTAKNAYPRYAPEGDWIAYTNNNTLLYAVPSDGGAQIQLTAANHVVNNAQDANPKETSMPTWAPPGDLRWVAFNSQRAYGLVTTGGTNQIWVAAVDFSRLDGGEVDPSYPAFRLPFQELTAKNHRAFWVQDIRATEDAGAPPDAGQPVDAGWPPDAGACVATGDVCNLASSSCCDAFLTGAFCGDPGDGGSQCVVPAFQ